MSEDTTPIPAGVSDEKTKVDVLPSAEEPATPTPNPDGQPPEGEAPQPNGEPAEDEATLKKRLDGAISKVEKTNEDMRRAVDAQVRLVQDDPELIHKLAQHDPKMANRVIESLWGEQHGIRTYKHLQERIELEELKETDPNAYESRKEIAELRAKVQKGEQKERERTLSRFLATKGIKNNQYDKDYSSLQSALSSVNPAIVEDDYEKALQIAHTIAFGSAGSSNPYHTEPPTLNYGHEQPTSLPTGRPQVSEQSSWLASELKKRGHKMEGF